MTRAEALAVKITEKRDETLRRKISERPQADDHSNRASELGHPCKRYLVLRRTAGKDASPPSPWLQAVFNEGRLHEQRIKADLMEMGFDPTSGERSFPPNAYEITGHIDGAVTFHHDEEWGDVGLEIKSLNPNHYAQIARNPTADGLRQAGPDFIRKWYVQTQVYLFLSGLDGWVVIIKNKSSGEWCVIAVGIDLDFVQTYLDRAEEINAHVEGGTLPDYHDESAVCLRCPFYQRACEPPIDSRGAMVVTQGRLAELAADYIPRHRGAEEAKGAKQAFHEALKAVTAGEDRTLLFEDGLVIVRHDTRGAMRMDVVAYTS